MPNDQEVAIEIPCPGQEGRVIGRGGATIRDIERVSGANCKSRQRIGHLQRARQTNRRHSSETSGFRNHGVREGYVRYATARRICARKYV